MKKLIVTAAAGALLVALAGAPNAARAEAYEDSLDNCAYPKLFDLMVMRPLSFSALAVGTALWVPMAPWTLLTSKSDMDTVTSKLVTEPARFTFGRPLGECVISGF
jgi:hypothetical protein